jgi:hypothetical protein
MKEELRRNRPHDALPDDQLVDCEYSDNKKQDTENKREYPRLVEQIVQA